jgi:hypothetical protein
MGGSTTFNFKNLPSTFTVSSGLSSGGGTTGAINIQWARYL